MSYPLSETARAQLKRYKRCLERHLSPSNLLVLKLFAMPPRNCWTNSDESDGSSFHEIITLPTLAPHAVLPEYAAPYLPTPSTTQATNISDNILLSSTSEVADRKSVV